MHVLKIWDAYVTVILKWDVKGNNTRTYYMKRAEVTQNHFQWCTLSTGGCTDTASAAL
jgi:hypothetical protein